MQIKQKESHKQWTNKKETSQNLGECGENRHYRFHLKRPLIQSLFVAVKLLLPIPLKELSARRAGLLLLNSFRHYCIIETKVQLYNHEKNF